MRAILTMFQADQSGVTSIEYAVIASMVSMVVLAIAEAGPYLAGVFELVVNGIGI